MRKQKTGNSLTVEWSLPGAGIQSVVGELRAANHTEQQKREKKQTEHNERK